MADKKQMRDMPHNLEAEQSLLGCLLLDPKIQVEIASSLFEEDFYAESHQYIFHAMSEIINNNQPVDLVTLSDKLEKQGMLEKAGGISYITELADVMPSSANFQQYLDIVQRDSVLRKLIQGSAKIIDDCMKSSDKISSISYAEKTIFDISNTADSSEYERISAIIPDVMMELDELSKNKGKLSGIKTNFTELDNLLDGLHQSDLIILAARPSVGKTTLAMNIMENIAMNGNSCAVFSLEMSKEQLVKRMFSSVSGVPKEKVERGTMDRRDWLNIAKAKEVLSEARLFIDDTSGLRPMELLSKCRRIKRKYGLDAVMVDYLQLMTPDRRTKDGNRQQEITEISRMLKLVAKEIKVPVIALSQLSRDSEKKKARPQLSDLRESGAIEQDADIVMFIHRPDRYAGEQAIKDGTVKKNVAEILVEKHRNGSTGMFNLYFEGECVRFRNLTSEDEIEGGNGKKAQTYNGDEQSTPFSPTEEEPPAEDEDDIF